MRIPFECGSVKPTYIVTLASNKRVQGVKGKHGAKATPISLKELNFLEDDAYAQGMQALIFFVEIIQQAQQHPYLRPTM